MSILATVILAAAALGVAFATFIVWKAMSNTRADEARPESNRVQIAMGCRECSKMVHQSSIRNGLCPECCESADKAAPVTMEPTARMINAGLKEIKAHAEPDGEAVAKVFQAMLGALPLEQKRIFLRSFAFTSGEMARSDQAEQEAA